MAVKMVVRPIAKLSKEAWSGPGCTSNSPTAEWTCPHDPEVTVSNPVTATFGKRSRQGETPVRSASCFTLVRLACDSGKTSLTPKRSRLAGSAQTGTSMPQEAPCPHPLLPCSPPDVSPATTALPSNYINHPTAPRSSCCAGHRPRASWNPTRED